MKKTFLFIYLIIILLISHSCTINNFEVVSNDNRLLSFDEKLKIDNFLITARDRFESSAAEEESENYDGEHFHNYIKNIKVIKSTFSILNNSNQIIENSSLIVITKFTFENEKKFNHICDISSNEIWKKNETLNFETLSIFDLNRNYPDYTSNLNMFENNYESSEAIHLQKILQIHKPINVSIEYYINAKNSIGYNNSKKLKDIERKYGEKIFNKNITDLWNKIDNDKLKNEKIKNGDLNKTFNATNSSNIINEERIKLVKDSLFSKGWKEEEVENGQLSNCYNFKPSKGKINNHLEVIVGSGTDVSIKIMTVNTDKCVRYVFINSGSTYKIENIPEGKYYLKIAYGREWLSKIENGQCIGKFVKNPLYEKGEDILDYNIQKNINGISIPSYKLSLDVVSTGVSNSFNSQNISENDFNK